MRSPWGETAANEGSPKVRRFMRWAWAARLVRVLWQLWQRLSGRADRIAILSQFQYARPRILREAVAGNHAKPQAN